MSEVWAEVTLVKSRKDNNWVGKKRGLREDMIYASQVFRMRNNGDVVQLQK